MVGFQGCHCDLNFVARTIYTNRNRVVKYDYTYQGSVEGPLNQAQFDFPREILILAEEILILADKNNHRLRMLDLQNSNTWSICSGVGGHKGGNFYIL